MKRDKANAVIFFDKIQTTPLLKKQVSEFDKLPVKEAAEQIVRLGRMHGFYFSENDWISLRSEAVPTKKAA